MLYSEKVMDHFQNPRNLGKMEDADGIGEVGNAVCGDIMKIYIKVDKVKKLRKHLNFQTKLLWKRWTGFLLIKFTALFLLKKL